MQLSDALRMTQEETFVVDLVVGMLRDYSEAKASPCRISSSWQAVRLIQNICKFRTSAAGTSNELTIWVIIAPQGQSTPLSLTIHPFGLWTCLQRYAEGRGLSPFIFRHEVSVRFIVNMVKASD